MSQSCQRPHVCVTRGRVLNDEGSVCPGAALGRALLGQSTAEGLCNVVLTHFGTRGVYQKEAQKTPSRRSKFNLTKTP